MAGFTWTQTIAQYGTIEAVDINEIRTNVDWLYDRQYYCATHYATHLATHYGTNLSAHYSNYCGAYQGYCGNDFTAV